MARSVPLVLLLCACGTYKVQRAALVPHQQPIMRSGQPVDGRGEVALGSSAISLGDPELAPDNNAGLYIPKLHVGAAARIKALEGVDVGLIWDHGLRQGADAIQPGQPPLDGGDVVGGGMSMFYSARTSNPALRIGIGLDLLFYSVPYIEYTSCVANCGIDPWTIQDEQRDIVPVLALAALPSYKLGQVTIFGGLTVRNHPTIVRTEYQDGGEVLFEDDSPEAGPANFIASVGVEAEVGQGIRIGGLVYQPVLAEPVRYKPAAGLSLTIPLGRERSPAGTPVNPY